MGCYLWSLCYKCKMSNLVIRTWARLSSKIVQTYLYLPMLSKIRTESLGSFFYIACDRIQIGVSCYPFFLCQKWVPCFHISSMWPCALGHSGETFTFHNPGGITISVFLSCKGCPLHTWQLKGPPLGTVLDAGVLQSRLDQSGHWTRLEQPALLLENLEVRIRWDHCILFS